MATEKKQNIFEYIERDKGVAHIKMKERNIC